MIAVKLDSYISIQVTDKSPEDKYEALSRYARDFTAMAKQGKLDPVIGRDEEMRRCIQVSGLLVSDHRGYKSARRSTFMYVRTDPI